MGKIESVDIKKEKLMFELEKPEAIQNKKKIERLRKSIERNKSITRCLRRRKIRHQQRQR